LVTWAGTSTEPYGRWVSPIHLIRQIARLAHTGTTISHELRALDVFHRQDHRRSGRRLLSYDPFGNVKKTGNSSWLPNYNNKNQYTSISGATPSYDASGNLQADGFHNYIWNAYGQLSSIDSTIVLTYDALGRVVEQNQSGTYFQVVYSPMGTKLAIMKGQTVSRHLFRYRVARQPNTCHGDWVTTGMPTGWEANA